MEERGEDVIEEGGENATEGERGGDEKDASLKNDDKDAEND